MTISSPLIPTRNHHLKKITDTHHSNLDTRRLHHQGQHLALHHSIKGTFHTDLEELSRVLRLLVEMKGFTGRVGLGCD